MRFNIIYYFPRRVFFRRWVYGYDIIQIIEAIYKGEINIIGVKNISEVYKLDCKVDMYIICNRIKGHEFFKNVCDKLKIPGYYSDKEPDVKEIVKLIDKLK